MNNNEHTLDKTVRQALENLEIPFNADHWELMVGKLDALNAEDAEFDTHIASKLAGVAVPFVPAHWAGMSERLDKLDAEDFDFDKNLAYKLADIEVPYSAANWANMSDRLNELDNAETSFDTLIRQRLDNIQPNMPANHWELMVDKIDDAFSWRRKIVRYKVVEVALVLLTLFTVWNTLDLPFDSVRSTDNNNTSPKIESNIKGSLKNNTPEKVKETKSFYNPTDWRNRPVTPNNKVKSEQNTPNKPIVAVENGDVITNPTAVSGTNNNVDKKAAGIVPTNKTAQSTSLVQNESYNNLMSQNPQIGESITDVKPNKGVENGVDTDGTSRDNREGGKMAEFSTPKVSELPTELLTRKVLALGKVTDGFEKTEDVATLAATELNPMDILKPSLLNTRVYDENIIFPKAKEKKAKWRLNSFVLPIADLVTSYSIQNRVKTAQSQKIANLGAGVAIGYKKGKFEVETGLSYLDKKYDLANVEVIYGGFLRTYSTVKHQNLHLSIASIPLSVNYTAKETRRWRFYARAGAAFNAILKSDESQFTTTDGLKNNDPSVSKIPFHIFEPNFYHNGLFRINRETASSNAVTARTSQEENLSLVKRNSYVTANAGIGVEYRLNNNVDIYVQPTLDYHTGRGIGTLNDRIHSFSVQGGVKTKLK